jgi:tetrahydromethanopterin S-methyltransferase subunit G
MEAMRQSWTDERLDDFRGEVNRRFDDLSGSVDRRFGEVDRRFDEVERRFDGVDHELHRINDRLDGMNRAIVFCAVSLTGGMLAGFTGMIALVATQL